MIAIGSRTSQDLDSLTLLYLENRPDAWRDWFRQQNANVVQGNGMMMDQFSMMIQAAIEGLGIALLPEYLARGGDRDGPAEGAGLRPRDCRGGILARLAEGKGTLPPLAGI